METILINTTFSEYLCITCFLGAAGQEIMHWYNLRIELQNDVKFYTSPTYWVITLVSIIFFGLTTKLLADLVFAEETITNSKLFITAFGYPIIVKQALKLITKSMSSSNPKSRYAHTNTNTIFEISDYFKNF